jgi:hypothetical protein
LQRLGKARLSLDLAKELMEKGGNELLSASDRIAFSVLHEIMKVACAYVERCEHRIPKKLTFLAVRGIWPHRRVCLTPAAPSVIADYAANQY